MRVLLHLVLPAALIAAIATPVAAQTLPTRLVQQSDVRLIGSFDLPDAPGAGDRRCFEYQYPGAMGYNPATNSLIVKSHDWDSGWAGEVNIPSSLGGTATVRNGCKDITAGRINQINGQGNRVHVGGFLVKGTEMLISAFPYYSNGTGDPTHMTRSTDWSSNTVRGPIQVGGNASSGTIGGYMAHIPAVWQSALRGDMLTGQCCISIISRSSYGPSISAAYFNEILTQNQPGVTNLLGYPASNPLAPYGTSQPSQLWNGFTRIRGVVMPEGTASVLFIGRHGTGTWCYGTGAGCNDPIYGDQGEHAYPYRVQVWAYNAHELAQVAAGQRQPHSVQPYAVWELPGFSGVEVAGAALDSSGRLYVLENGGGPGARGRVHVYSVTGSEAPPPGDTTPPSVSLTSPGAGSTLSGTTTLSASASDNSGVAGVWFTVNGVTVGSEDATAPYQTSWNTTTASNGTHVIRALARDSAGNTAGSAEVTVTINNQTADTTAPTVSLTTPAAGATVSGTVAIAASASDNVGVTSVQFTLNGVNLGSADTTAPYSINWNTSGAANGSYSLRAVARDAAGNETASAARTVTVSNQTADTTSPSVSLTAPAAGATVSGTVTVSANASDNVGVTSVQFTLNGVNLGSADSTAPYAISWNTTGAANGVHVLSALARDAAGNTSSSTRSVTVNNQSVDQSLPSVALTTPSSGSTVSGQTVFEASASDNVAVAGVRFLVNGVQVGGEVTSAPYRMTWNSQTASNGTHGIQAMARDTAGNVRATPATWVTVSNTAGSSPSTPPPAPTDTTAPTVTVTGPSNWRSQSGFITLSASAFDNVGVASVQFTLDGTNVGTAVTTSPYLLSWNSATVDNGTYSLRAIARDAAGNATTSAARTLRINNSAEARAAAQRAVSTDLNADNLPDLLFQHASGQIKGWFMNGSSRLAEQATSVSTVGQGWKAVSLNDFSRDGKADVLWQYEGTGQLAMWILDGTQLLIETGVASGAHSVWKVAATGDVNGDGHTDIIWQHPSTGQVKIWLMYYWTLVTEVGLSPYRADPQWRLAAAGDFNADGRDDLVWEHRTSRQVTIWYMDSTGRVSDWEDTVSTPAPGGGWSMRAAADFDANGTADLIWQHNNGQVLIWFMGDEHVIRQETVTPAQTDPNWRVVGGNN